MTLTKFSIVASFYNLEDSYLIRFVDSIPDRNDIQVLLIDDGSTTELSNESKNKILQKSNVEIIRYEKNEGVGSVRNKSIDLVKGDWLIYADCDDEYFTEEFNQALDVIDNQKDYNVIYWGSCTYYLSGEVRPDTYGFCESKELVEITDRRFFINHRFECWRKAVKTSWLRENKTIRSSYVDSFQDVRYSVQMLLLAERVGLYPSVVYKYYKRAGSNLNKKWSQESVLKSADEILDCCRIIKKRGLLMDDMGPASMILDRIGKITKSLYIRYSIKFFFVSHKLWPKKFAQVVFDTYETNFWKALINRCIVIAGSYKRKLLRK